MSQHWHRMEDSSWVISRWPLKKKLRQKIAGGWDCMFPPNKLQMTLLLLIYMSQVIAMQEETSQSSSATTITKIYTFPQVVLF